MWLKKVPPMPLRHMNDRSKADALFCWKLFLKDRSTAEMIPMAMWLLRGLCNEVNGKTTAGFNRNWMGSMTSHLKIKGQGEKAWYRFAGCKKILTACGKLQLPEHRVYSESCFYVHRKYCFLGWSSDKVQPKLFAFMEKIRQEVSWLLLSRNRHLSAIVQNQTRFLLSDKTEFLG